MTDTGKISYKIQCAGTSRQWNYSANQVIKRHGGTLNDYYKGKEATLESYMLYDSNYATFWKTIEIKENSARQELKGGRNG